MSKKVRKSIDPFVFVTIVTRESERARFYASARAAGVEFNEWARLAIAEAAAP